MKKTNLDRAAEETRALSEWKRKERLKEIRFENRRDRITEVVMRRYFRDGFKDIGTLILNIETLIESEVIQQAEKKDE